jgi:hypothetical protein
MWHTFRTVFVGDVAAVLLRRTQETDNEGVVWRGAVSLNCFGRLTTASTVINPYGFFNRLCCDLPHEKEASQDVL